MNTLQATEQAMWNILEEGLDDIFSLPYEVGLLRDTEFRKTLSGIVARSIEHSSLQELGVSPIFYVLMPKTSEFDFRKAALMDPFSTIMYTTLALLVAEQIEQHRIPRAEKRVFSYRLKLNSSGSVFNRHYTFSAFKKCERERSQDNNVKVIVKTDIANFYDNINLLRLKAQLLSMGCEEHYVQLLYELLQFWADQKSIGLPTGSNASRILAEAMLVDVDSYLLEHNIDFIRFVDDYRFFAPDAATAHNWLMLLIERLSKEGLVLNKAKTKIEVVKKALRLQCVSTKDFTANYPLDDGGNPFRIMSGYAGAVPSLFRMPSDIDMEKIGNINLDKRLSDLVKNDVIKSEKGIEAIQLLLYKGKFNKIGVVLGCLDKCPQIIPFVVDLLIKHPELVKGSTRDMVKMEFEAMVMGKQLTPDYILLAIIRFFASVAYQDTKVLMKLFRELRRSSGDYIGRAILEGLADKASRNEVKELILGFDKCRSLEKRQIVRIVMNNYPTKEQMAWLYNNKSKHNDLFLSETINSGIHEFQSLECLY